MGRRPFRLDETALDWKPWSAAAVPATTSPELFAVNDQLFSLIAAAHQQPGKVLSYVLHGGTVIAVKSDGQQIFYATPSPTPEDFAFAGGDEGQVIGDLLGAPPIFEGATMGAQGNHNYSNDDLKGNGDAQDRTEDDEPYSGQVGATDRGEDFELTPVDQDPRMAGEDADDRDYVSGFGNAEARMDANRAFEQVLREDTDFWDLAQRTEGDSDPAEPPDGKQLLTEPSECEEADNGCNGWDVPWGEPPEGYRKVGVGESIIIPDFVYDNQHKFRR